MPGLREKIYKQIRIDLAQGRWQGGERLLETDLAAELNTSRIPVREALAMLTSEGLLEREAGYGCRVPTLDRDWWIDMYQYREAVEGMAARLAAARITPPDLMRLEQEHKIVENLVNTDTNKPGKNWGTRKEVDQRFHRLLVELSENRVLIEAWERQHIMLTSFDINRTPSASHHSAKLSKAEISRRNCAIDKAAIQEHGRIVAALAKNDPDEAEAAVRSHVARCWKETLKNADLSPKEADRSPRETELGISGSV